MRPCRIYPNAPADTPKMENERLRVNVAGVTCHAYSAEGKNEGPGHESEIPLGVWLAERAFLFEKGAEDVAFVECTPRFPAQARLEAAFGDQAWVFSIVDGPELHGWPHRRRRVFGVAINKLTCHWYGAENNADLKADYAKRFYRQMASTGEVLLHATEEQRVDEMMRLAIARKNNVSRPEMQEIIDAGDDDKLQMLIMPPGGIQRVQDWTKLFLEKKAETPNLRAFMCDVDHTVGGKGF